MKEKDRVYLGAGMESKCVHLRQGETIVYVKLDNRENLNILFRILAELIPSIVEIGSCERKDYDYT